MKSYKRSSLLTALVQPASLVMLALSAASGLCAAWWMAPVGMAFWLVVLITGFRDPALRLSNTVANRTTLAYRFQSKFERVEKTQTSLFMTLQLAPAGVQRAMKPVQSAVDGLVEQTYQVCQKFANVDNYITLTRENKDLDKQVSELENKLANTVVDERTRGEYEEALQTLKTQQQNLAEMSSLLERFETQLTTLTSTLETIQADAIRLQTVDPKFSHDEVPDMLHRINVQSSELTSFTKKI